MPLFEFICEDCHSRFELLLARNATPSCPACQSEKLVKQLSTFAVGKGESHASHADCGCGGPDDCIGNQAAAARARGNFTCC